MSFVMPKKKITPNDVIIISLVFVIGVVSLIFVFSKKRDTKNAVIKTGEDTLTVSLDTDGDYEFASNGYKFTAAVRNGEIYVVSSDCPDGVCRNTPPIGKRDGTIICLPAKMMIYCTAEVDDTNEADISVP